MNGRLSSITSGDTTVGFTYDAAGRIATSKQTTAGTEYPFSYSYYRDGSLQPQTYPSGRALTYGIDLMGRLTSVTGQLAGQTTPYASSASYAAHGGLTSVALGNGLVERWSYNEARQQPRRIQLGTAAEPNSVDEWLNDYCPTALFAGGSCAANNGNVMAQKVGSLGNAKTVYDYDWINRLLSATESGNGTGWSRTYGYDAHGNRWVSANAGVALSANTPTSLSNYTGTMDNRVTVNNARYDNAGNQTAIGGFSFTFDAENRVASSTILGNTTAYAYDGEGRRVKKGSTVFVYDAFGKLAAEYGGTPSPNQTEYLTADHLGSTRLVTKADGTRDRCYDYLPFGEEIPQGVSGRGPCYPADGSTPTSEKKFTGQFRDSETGLDYFNARYFSPAQGRFSSPDEWQGKAINPFPEHWVGQPGPLPYADITQPQSLNRYAHALNNPLKYTDPDGHCVTGWDTIICIAAAYAITDMVIQGIQLRNTINELELLAKNHENALDYVAKACSSGTREQCTGAIESAENTYRNFIGKRNQSLVGLAMFPGTFLGGPLPTSVAELGAQGAVSAATNTIIEAEARRQAEAEQRRRAEIEKRRRQMEETRRREMEERSNRLKSMYPDDHRRYQD